MQTAWLVMTWWAAIFFLFLIREEVCKGLRLHRMIKQERKILRFRERLAKDLSGRLRNEPYSPH